MHRCSSRFQSPDVSRGRYCCRDCCKQLTEAISEKTRESEISRRKQQISADDVRYFSYLRHILNEMFNQYMTLHVHFANNMQHFQTSKDPPVIDFIYQ